MGVRERYRAVGLLSAVLILFFLLQPWAVGADEVWPMFGQNLRHTRLSPYATGHNTGTKKWEFAAGNWIHSSPAIGSDGTLYVGSGDNKLYALNPKGTKKWEFATGFWIHSSPTIGPDGTLYVGSYDHKLYALNPDGTKKWEFETGGEILSSPAIGSDGTLYLGSCDHKLYALNPDGTKKWKFETGDVIFSSPAIGPDGTLYVGSYDNKLYALNPDGTKKWEFATSNLIASSPAIGSDGTIYVGSWDRKLYALNPDGTKKWEFATSNLIDSSPAIGSDGTLYVGSGDNKLYALNPDGTKKWEFATGSWIYSSPAIGSDGTIYVGSDDHKLYAIGSYTITATAGSGGSVSPAGNVNVVPGADQSFTVTADIGYHIVDVLVDGSSVGAVSSYTFTDVAADHTIAASFAINTYTLTYRAGANGTLSGSASQTVNHGGDGVPVTGTPNGGYHFVQWSDGNTSNPRTDTGVTGPVDVTASFALNSYTITATAGFGGSLSPAGSVNVTHGANQGFTVYPDRGYRILDLVVDGASQGALDSYTFRNVTADHRVHALFAAYALEVKITNPKEGETLSGDVEVIGEVSGDAAVTRVGLTVDGTLLEGPLPESAGRRILSGSLSLDLTDALLLSLDGGKRLRKRTVAGDVPVLTPDLPVESISADPSGAIHLILTEPVTLDGGRTTVWLKVDPTGDSLSGINASPACAPRFDAEGRGYFVDSSGSLLRLNGDLTETLVERMDLPKGLRIGRFLVLSAQEVVYTLEEAGGLRSILLWRSGQGSAPYLPPRGSSLEEALMRSGTALLTATPRGELLTQGFGRLGLESKENPSLEVFDQGIRFHCAAAVDEGFLLGGRRADGAAGAWRMDRQGRLTLITELERAPLGLVVVPPAASEPRSSTNAYRWLWKTRDFQNGPHILTLTVEGEANDNDQVRVNTLNVRMGLTLTRLQDRGWLIRKDFVRVDLTLSDGQAGVDRLILYRRADQGKEIRVKEFAASECASGTLRYDDLSIARGEHGVYRAEALSKSGQVIGLAPEARY